MRRLWEVLPGPAPVKTIELVVLAAVALAILFFLFEWAGDLLDSGVVIGA